jgi:hypothetical protein
MIFLPAVLWQHRLGYLMTAMVLAVATVTMASMAAEDQSAKPDVRSGSGIAPLSLPEGVVAECQFLPGTVIPLVAIGIRTLDDPPEMRDRRLLDLWDRPENAAPGVIPRIQVPLFRPYFVYDRRTVDGTTWHLLGEAYAGSPLGWADGRQLRMLESRYGYHFNNPRRVPPGVQLYRSREAAYKALEAQSRVPPETPREDVVVAERIQEEHWNPLAGDAIPPFIELGDDEDLKGRYAAGLTDTTLTFPYHGENRLIQLGAVAGGPVDREAIAKKRASAEERAGIAIVFVIDETLSMQKFFGGVADFIDKNLDLGANAVNVRVAVSWYSDIEQVKDVPYVVQPLQPLNGPAMNAATAAGAKGLIVDGVRNHKDRIIGGVGAQAEELIYEGLVEAIKQAGFARGENAMVFVIGDAPDRYEEEEDASLKRRFVELQAELEGLIETHNLQVAFVQVGDVARVGTGFADQATRFRKTLKHELRQAVIVQGPGEKPLQNRIAELQRQMDRRRTELLSEIAEMESRNRYSEPGPALEQKFVQNDVSREAFDRSHLQFFEPAWGWLYHPQQPEATPQLRELVFLAKPESDALIPALVRAAEGLEAEGRIDVDSTRKLLAETLARQSGHAGVVAAIEAAWQGLPKDDRTFGRFLEQGMGLRVRNPLLFHRGVANPKAGPTRQSVGLLLDSRNRIGNARKEGVTWADAWKVLP